MKYDFLIAASLTDGFCGQIAFFRLCLNALGGDYAQARLVAVFGDPPQEEVPKHWQAHFDGIEVAWVYSKTGDPHAEGYAAQHLKRFDLIRPDCDLAILCDADVAPMRPFKELADRLIERSALGGVIAHFHFPMEGRKEKLPDVDWPMISNAILGYELDRPYRYTLKPAATPPQAPFYINYGVFAGPPHILKAFHAAEQELRAALQAQVGPWWGPQISVPLAAAKAGLATDALPMRYNFPNDPRAEAQYPRQMRNVVFMHYLRMKHFRRDCIFASKDAFDRFIAKPLEGSDAIFQEHVRRITGGVFPFQGAATDILTLNR